MEVDIDAVSDDALGHSAVGGHDDPLLLGVEAVAIGSLANLVEHPHFYQGPRFVRHHPHLHQVACSQLEDLSHFLSALDDTRPVKVGSLFYFCIRRQNLVAMDPCTDGLILGSNTLFLKHVERNVGSIFKEQGKELVNCALQHVHARLFEVV